MVAIPFYSITPCCPELGAQVLNFRIPGGILNSGVYVYEGATIVDAINGVSFKNGFCYTIRKLGTSSGTLPIAPNYVDFSLGDSCSDLTCEACTPNTCYLVIPCDGTDSFVSNTPELEDFVNQFITVENANFYGCIYVVKLDETYCPDAVEVKVYEDEPCDCNLRCFYVSNSNGFLYVDEANILQEVSAIQAKPYLKVCSKIYPVVQNDSQDFEIINFGDCINNTCQEQCFKLTNCDTQEIIYSQSSSLTQDIAKTVTLNGQEGCWEVSLVSANCDCINVTFAGSSGTDTYTANATGTYSGYNLYEFIVDGDIYYIYYVPGKGWYISADGYGNSPSETLIAFTSFTGECPDSINEDFIWELEETILNSIQTEVCPAECDCPIPVTVLKSFDGCPSCLPIIAYKFTNCNNQTLVQYSTEDYSAYVGKTVELECGNCWFVSQIDYTPPSTQTITILFTFDSCIACNRTYYKLTDCLDPNNVTYTYTDLSSLIPPPVIGCDCISVTYTLIGEAPVTVEVDKLEDGSFKNVLDIDGLLYSIEFNIMLQQWTVLYDGPFLATLSENTPCPFGVYTIEEESIFEEFVISECGSLPVIKIKGCSNCFTVEETREPVNPGTVEVTDSYIDCPECSVTFPCLCSTISNTTTEVQTYCYIDCDFGIQSVELQPGETSDKICVIKWIECPETCECVTGSLTSNGDTTTYEFLPTGETYNGKPVYQDCFNSNPACDIPFPIDACYTIKYENDNCWYAAVTNNCVTNIPQVFKKCSESACSTDPWEYIPCTILAVYIGGELPFQAVLSVNDYTADNFSYGNPTSGFYVAFNTAINQWEMSFDGDVFETLEEGVSPCDGTNDNRVNWGTGFFVPQTWDPYAPGPYELTTERCGDAFSVSDLNLAYIQFYGECINNTCPVAPLPKRKVKPGYSTPTCDIEKYEKITCRSSEIYYKQVMRLRYGISNCCPEDEEKWLIKKELIDLQALVDPDYICTPVTSCCGQTLTSCGCGCNQTLKTCNSQ